jgi:hypothetical protein
MQFTSYRQNTNELKNLLAHMPLGTFETSQICPRARISHKYAPGGGGRLAGGEVRPGRATSGPRLRLGLPVPDWGACFGRRGRRRAAAARQGQHGRDGAKSGEGEGSTGQCVAGKAPT